MNGSLDQWTEDDLRGLIGQDEGLTVEFKRSDSLRFKTDSGRLKAELAKDVSAMANAAGGRIYYGIVEDKGSGRAISIDGGLTADEVTADQIGNLLTGNIEPAIMGVRIWRINLANGNSAFVIDVPQATTMAPHQSRTDRVYYRRHDRKALPMYDHQIKDIMRRADKPLVFAQVLLKPTGEPSVFDMEVVFENSTDIPILYYSLDVILQGSINVLRPVPHCEAFPHNFTVSKSTYSGTAYQRNFVTPYAIPLFRPRACKLWEASIDVASGKKHGFAVSFTAPGFHGYWSGYIDRTTPVTSVSLKPDL